MRVPRDYQTEQSGTGLPGGGRCPSCALDNPPGMNFCRNCGTRLAAAPAQPGGNLGALGSGQPGGARSPDPALQPVAGVVGMPAPAAVVSGRAMSSSPVRPTPPSGVPVRPTPPAGVMLGSALAASTQSCPHCRAQTPAGFAFCQQCGKALGSAPGVGPGAPASPAVIRGDTGGGVDAMGPTLAAADDPVVARLRAASEAGTPARASADASGGASGSASGMITPESSRARVSPAWGFIISINRDGSDGERHALRGEWLAIGRAQADIGFPDDRFLAPQHARIERVAGGARIVPLDSLNGVFYRVSEPTPLSDGDLLLLGREIMRFELVDQDEREAKPLVRHGVALFGSPPREPWGRLMQLLASGGVRDVRHLYTPVVTLGREEGDLVFPDDQFLSRRHATFSWQDGDCLVEDLGSSNGTYVRLLGPMTLRSGDQLRMGDQVFRFELEA
jgi:pSer/pThr/pTyr-binding forkhead associated (FHA) protein